MGLRDKGADKEVKRAEREAAAARQREHFAAQRIAWQATQSGLARPPDDQERERLRAEQAASCPLALAPDPSGTLPSGVKLQHDEFLVTIGKDWGWSSQRLLLTTHRVIQTHGRASKTAKSLYLTDVRDVAYHKPLMGFATITLESASGGHSLEGLPAAKNGSALRDQLTSLVHWARTRQSAPGTTAAPVPAGDDVLDTIKRLADLRDAGALTSDEFETKKRELLDRL